MVFLNKSCSLSFSVLRYLFKVFLVSHLRNAREPDEVADQAGDGDEDFLPAAQQLGPLVDDGSDEPFHGAELAVQTDEEQHEEEETRPERRAWKLQDC